MTTLELVARLDNLLSTAEAETANIDLFGPIPERGECPICLLPLPLKNGDTETKFMPCCGKCICKGCVIKNLLTEKEKGVTAEEFKCVFCRQLMEEACKDEIKV